MRLVSNLSVNWRFILKVLLGTIVIVLFIVTHVSVYILGLISGYNLGQGYKEDYLSSLLKKVPTPTETQIKPTQAPVISPKVVAKTKVSWGGPELWDAVNKRRVELGVNPLQTRSELCTIASIRLNELLELGKLDNHEGFSSMPNSRPDLKWIFDNYSVIAEFLAVGGETPEETVSLWENTLGHRKLLDGGEFVWGCIYAQNTFSVAITAY